MVKQQLKTQPIGLEFEQIYELGTEKIKSVYVGSRDLFGQRVEVFVARAYRDTIAEYYIDQKVISLDGRWITNPTHNGGIFYSERSYDSGMVRRFRNYSSLLENKGL